MVPKKVLEPIEIETGPTVDLDTLYELDYGAVVENIMLKNQPDFSNCLKNTSIKESLRAKMVDWTIEVLSNYH